MSFILIGGGGGVWCNGDKMTKNPRNMSTIFIFFLMEIYSDSLIKCHDTNLILILIFFMKSDFEFFFSCSDSTNFRRIHYFRPSLYELIDKFGKIIFQNIFTNNWRIAFCIVHFWNNILCARNFCSVMTGYSSTVLIFLLLAWLGTIKNIFSAFSFIQKIIIIVNR